jgi:hypothetical protein
MLPDNGASVPAVWYATAALYRRLRFSPARRLRRRSFLRPRGGAEAPRSAKKLHFFLAMNLCWPYIERDSVGNFSD